MESYTVYSINQGGTCQNETIHGDETTYTVTNGLKEIQIGAHRNDMTNCSQGMLSCNYPYLTPLHSTGIFSV